MKKDGKYRFNLGFGATTREEIRVGELLESLGQKKSAVVIAALIEYMDRHPELIHKKGTLEITFSKATPEHLETIIRRLIDERLSSPDTTITSDSIPMQKEQISNDIFDMLGDLSSFN